MLRKDTGPRQSERHRHWQLQVYNNITRIWSLLKELEKHTVLTPITSAPATSRVPASQDNLPAVPHVSASTAKEVAIEKRKASRHACVSSPYGSKLPLLTASPGWSSSASAAFVRSGNCIRKKGQLISNFSVSVESLYLCHRTVYSVDELK